MKKKMMKMNIKSKQIESICDFKSEDEFKS